MIKTALSLYTLKLPLYFVYMLQQVEYSPAKFLEWLQKIFEKGQKISKVSSRGDLKFTSKAKMLLISSYLLFGVLAIFYGLVFSDSPVLLIMNFAMLIIAYPYILLIGLSMITYIASIIIIEPKSKKMESSAKQIFSNHKAVKISVLGSYGKTSMKELLDTILSEKLEIASTQGNMNTTISHARFAQKLTGNEEVIILEFGEGEPGDIKKMAEIFKPDYAIITGLAPNHLDQYKNMENLSDDLLSIKDYVDNEKLFVSSSVQKINKKAPKGSVVYSDLEVANWKITNKIISVVDTSFTIKKGKKVLNIKTNLIGRHQIAPVALGVHIADILGLSKAQISTGCSKVIPYEHRMQPRKLHGAWLIDDTYNGNIEGMKAGLMLLSELDMNRKWYVTPGLVDQGVETDRVHKELGEYIAEYNPDITVLMDNSARPVIEKSMKANKYSGKIRIETEPLSFYQNIEHLVVNGDVVLMQNDWTDNYN